MPAQNLRHNDWGGQNSWWELLGGILSRQDEMIRMLHHLQQGQSQIMSAMDDLNKAIDEAVAAMNHAVTTMQNNNTNNDPAIEAAAQRLSSAVSALTAADPV